MAAEIAPLEAACHGAEEALKSGDKAKAKQLAAAALDGLQERAKRAGAALDRLNGDARKPDWMPYAPRKFSASAWEGRLKAVLKKAE